jgi:hypothetical protein
MEAASWLAGEPWSDHPHCVHPVIARVARRANDRAGEADRQRLWPLILASLGTGVERQFRVGFRLRRKSWRLERLGSHAEQTNHLRNLWSDLVAEHARLTGHRPPPLDDQLLGALRSHLAGGRPS